MGDAAESETERAAAAAETTARAAHMEDINATTLLVQLFSEEHGRSPTEEEMERMTDAYEQVDLADVLGPPIEADEANRWRGYARLAFVKAREREPTDKELSQYADILARAGRLAAREAVVAAEATNELDEVPDAASPVVFFEKSMRDARLAFREKHGRDPTEEELHKYVLYALRATLQKREGRDPTLAEYKAACESEGIPAAVLQSYLPHDRRMRWVLF